MINPFSLENKTIIVTGASSGIGAQCAIDCSKMGAKIVLIARNEERLGETMSQLEGFGHLKISFDLQEIDKISSVVKTVVEQCGKISGVINCAGISSVKPIKLVKPEELDSIVKTNVYGTYFLTKEVCGLGKYDKNGCSIIFLSSVMGIVGESCKSLYSLSKGALISTARSLAVELSKKNIRVNCISPGAIETPINKNARHMSEPELRKQLEDKHLLGLGKTTDISNACIFLLSDASRWITGQNLVIDGGYTAQ